MPQYRVSFSETTYGYYYIEADSEEQAEELVEKAYDYGWDEAVPSAYQKIMGGETEYGSPETY